MRLLGVLLFMLAMLGVYAVLTMLGADLWKGPGQFTWQARVALGYGAILAVGSYLGLHSVRVAGRVGIWIWWVFVAAVPVIVVLFSTPGRDSHKGASLAGLLVLVIVGAATVVVVALKTIAGTRGRLPALQKHWMPASNDDSREYSRVIERDPENPANARVYAERGKAHVAKGYYDLALADFDTALRLDPPSRHFYL